MRRFLAFIFTFLSLSLISQTDTATIMYFNVLNFPGSTADRIQYFRIINQYIRPDIIVISEINSATGADLLLQSGLNVYGACNYSRAPFIDGPDSDNMLFYRNDKFGLYSTDTIQTALRNIGEYVVYHKNPDPLTDTVFLYLYSAHLKASTGTDNQQKRLAEVLRYKQHVNAKSGITNMIFGGDFNLYTASEPAYNSLIVQGNYPLTDVLPAGSWHDNSSYAPIHTQSTRTDQFGGGATGGLDDRFDFMLFTQDLITGTNKVRYIPNSYTSFGNDGNHFNLAIIDLPQNNLLPDSVIQALYNMSDHLPIFGKFEIETGNIPPQFELSLKVYLEGPINGTEMSTSLIPVMPLSSPYNQPPWNFQGNSSVSSIPSLDVTDWILVELRDAPDAATANSQTIISRHSAFLMKDGSIKNLDGVTNLQFTSSINHQLFIVIFHRNHLGIMNSLPPGLTGNIYSYDFTNGLNKAYLNGQKQLSVNVWGMIAGDCNANGQVNETDITLIWNEQSGMSGYSAGDINFDREINNKDKNEFLIINYLQQSVIPQ